MANPRLFLGLVFGLALSAQAGQWIPNGAVLQGKVTFCNDLKSAHLLAESTGTPYFTAVARKLGELKKCGTYQGVYIVLDIKELVHGLEIYKGASQVSGDFYFFSKVPLQGSEA